MVLGAHFFWNYEPPPGFGRVKIILTNSHLGVSIFFVISGFLITTLLLNEQKKSGRISLKDFYIRRIFRIFPAYFLYLGVLGLLTTAGVLYVGWSDFLRAGLFIWNYSNWQPGFNWYVAHTWSLSVEEQFYLLWPATLIIAGRKKSAWIALIIIVACPVFRWVEYKYFPLFIGSIYNTTHTRADTIMFGCLAALLSDNEKFDSIVEVVYHYGGFYVAGFIAFVLPVVARLGGINEAVFSYTIDGVAITVLIMCAIRSAHGMAGRVLNWWPLVHVGTISYSLYMWQQLFSAPESCPLKFRPVNGFLFAVMAAEASYYFIEQPFLKLRVRLFHDRKPAGPPL